MYYLGVDLGGTNIKAALVSENGEIVKEAAAPTNLPRTAQEVCDDIAALCLQLGAGEPVAGIGVGCPGTVCDGVVLYSNNLDWHDFAMADYLQAKTGLPVCIGNDANVAALGEFWKGGGQGCENIVFVTLGTGVGGGIIVEGRLLHGTHGSGAELGHMVLDPRETAVCGCGKRGCVEQYCSATGIVRLAKLRLDKDGAASSLRALTDLTCRDIFDAGKAGDAVALEILDQYYDYMGQFLGSVCSAVDPEAVVIGGGVSKAGHVLLEGIEPYFHKYVFHAASQVRFALASLGNDAGAYGAFKLAVDAFAK